MHGIYVAAVFASLAAFAVLGTILRSEGRRHRPFLASIVLFEIPMCALAYYLLRQPLDWLLCWLAGPTSALRTVLIPLYAPVTEELAKLSIFLFPWFALRFRPTLSVPTALAVGLGFGVGETWFVAYLVAGSPGLPWYLYGGFMVERFMVCFLHAAFTALPLALWRDRPARGLAGAVALHFLGNFPIFLAARNVGGIGRDAWAALLQIWVALYFAAAVALLVFLTRQTRSDESAFSTMACPHCRTRYTNGILGLRLGPWRWEPCPACHRWHLSRPVDDDRR